MSVTFDNRGTQQKLELISQPSIPTSQRKVGQTAALRVMKRACDLLIVAAAAPAALLLIALAGLATLVTSGRPVFFIQKRVGLHGRIFKMVKLRTMANSQSVLAVATSVQDNRITRVGRLLRIYRIDELPQLLNVLKGEMSLIGPRPEQPALVDEYRRHLPNFDDRHLVKPGITGLAQVMYGYASNLKETRNKLRYDLIYVRNSSLALEAQIAVRTVKTVLGCERVR